MSQPPNQPPYPEQPSGQPYPAYGAQPGPPQPYPASPYPGPGSPYQGQPNPDVPQSVPPGYSPQPGYGAQPQYPQPDYSQAGYPQSGPPMAAGYPPPPKPKSRALPITLVSIAVVLVLCVGGGTALYLVGRNAADKVSTSRSAAPVVPPTTTPQRTEATEAPEAEITVVEPKRLGGRPKVTDKQFAGAVDQLKKELAELPQASETVGALYGTPAKQDLVVVAAAAAEVSNPTSELNATFLGAGITGLKLSGITTTSPGSLGGVAKCGKGNAGGAPVILCAWADDGSVGWIIWYYESMSNAKAEFTKLREQVEQVSR